MRLNNPSPATSSCINSFVVSVYNISRRIFRFNPFVHFAQLRLMSKDPIPSYSTNHGGYTPGTIRFSRNCGSEDATMDQPRYCGEGWLPSAPYIGRSPSTSPGYAHDALERRYTFNSRYVGDSIRRLDPLIANAIHDASVIWILLSKCQRCRQLSHPPCRTNKCVHLASVQRII